MVHSVNLRFAGVVGVFVSEVTEVDCEVGAFGTGRVLLGGTDSVVLGAVLVTGAPEPPT